MLQGKPYIFFTLLLTDLLVDLEHKEAATGDVLWKKVFLKFFQNSQENTCAIVSF